jgi:hypothetical protein
MSITQTDVDTAQALVDEFLEARKICMAKASRHVVDASGDVEILDAIGDAGRYLQPFVAAGLLKLTEAREVLASAGHAVGVERISALQCASSAVR